MITDRWLIRSSGRILGPFTTDEIVELIKTRAVTVHDEVAGPMEFWQSLSQKEGFSDLIHHISLELNDSETSTSTGFLEETQTLSVTSNIEDFNDEQTERLDVVGDDEGDEEIVYADIVEEPITTKSEPRSSQVRSYGVEPSAATKKQVKKSGARVWGLVIVVALAVFAFVFKSKKDEKQQLAKTIPISKNNFKDAIELGRTKLFNGRYKEALAYFKRAHSLDKGDRSLYIFLGSLMTQLDESEVEARDYLLKASEIDDVNTKKRSFVSLGLLALKESDAIGAETYFKKALELDDQMLPALVNLAMLYEENGNHKLSVEYFQSAVKKSKNLGLIYYLQAISELDRHRNGEKVNLSDISKMLNKVISSQGYLYQEASVLKAYIMTLNSDKNVDKQLRHLLDIDPDLINNFRWNLFISRSWLTWQRLLPYCESIAAHVGDSGVNSVFQAICNIKAGDSFKSNTLATKAISQDPENALVLANVAYIKGQANLLAEEKSFIAQSVKYNQSTGYKLPSLMQSEKCFESKNEDCVIREGTRVLREDPRNFTALNVLARTYLYKGDMKKAKVYAYRIFKYTDDYIPVLEIKNSFEAKAQ